MFQFDSLLPKGLSLYPHQTSGVATALLERRLILGDEMGLGKSVQALVAVEAANAYPAVIACPASLRANWAKEITMFLPHREAFIASARPARCGADFIIVSYASLHHWANAFCELQAVVLDESHCCSNPTRRRSRAALALVRQLPKRGLVLALTGTPFINRPAELVSQLRLIGRLHALTPQPEASNDERAWALNFREEWCKDLPSLRQLHRALCQTCYVRCQRKDVLGRNDTRRHLVKLTLDLAEYREAEADLVAYLTERSGTEAAARAKNVEGLAKLSHLRRLVGEAKIWAARHWIDNFLASTERSLVVFAYHRSVQKALVEHYRCAHILGGQQVVEEQKKLFQAGESRLIVCSLTAGREGHTLSRASDVLFVELGWAPGVHAQAEDRVNRIGQEADDTFAWYLLGAGTVDESVWGIIEAKRVLFDAGAEGRPAGYNSEQATAIEVLDRFRLREPSVTPALVHHEGAVILPFRKKGA